MGMSYESERWLELLQADTERKITDGEDPRTASRDMFRAICERVDGEGEKEAKIEELENALEEAKSEASDQEEENKKLEANIEEYKKAFDVGLAERLEVLASDLKDARQNYLEEEEKHVETRRQLREIQAERAGLEKSLRDAEKVRDRAAAACAEKRNAVPAWIKIKKLADLKKFPKGTKLSGGQRTITLTDPANLMGVLDGADESKSLLEVTKAFTVVPTAEGFALYDKLGQLYNAITITRPDEEETAS